MRHVGVREGTNINARAQNENDIEAQIVGFMQQFLEVFPIQPEENRVVPRRLKNAFRMPGFDLPSSTDWATKILSQHSAH